MSTPTASPHLPPPQVRAGSLSSGGSPFLALLWGGALWALLRHLPQLTTWQVLAYCCLISLPVATTGMYLSSVAQCRRLTWFASQGLLYGLLSGRWLRLLLWSLWAGLSGLFLVLELRTFTRQDWLTAAAALPVFWLTFTLARRLLHVELRAYLVTAAALRTAQWLTPVIMVALVLSAARHLGPVVHYESTADAVQAARQQFGDFSASPLLSMLTGWFSIWRGARAYLIGCAAPGEDWAATAIAIGGLFILFANVSGSIACFLLPRDEFRRAFARPGDADMPGPVSALRVLGSAFLILLPMAAIVLGGHFFEQRQALSIHARQQNADALRWVESHFSTAVDRIGGQIYQRGTLARLEELRGTHLAQLRREALQPLQAQIHAAFGLMETRVDGFLDEYYTLGADYKRLGSLVTGSLRDHLQQRLQEKLGSLALMQQVDQAYQQALRLNTQLDQAYQAQVKTLLDASRIIQAPRAARVVAEEKSTAILTLPRAPEIMAFETRLGISAGVGAVSGALAGAVTARVVNRVVGGQAYRVALELIEQGAKKAAGRGAGAAGGALAGAAVGSVVPVVGTGIGAAVGLVVGIASSVAIDATLLELDEALNRQAFKEEILTSLRSTRAELSEGFLPVMP